MQVIIAAPVEEHFTEHDRADDRIDELQREVLNAVQGVASGCSVRDGVDMALLAAHVFRGRIQPATTAVLTGPWTAAGLPW